MSVDDSTLNRIILECVAEFRLKYYKDTELQELQKLIDNHLDIIHTIWVEMFTPDDRRTLIPYINRYIEGIKYYILIVDVDTGSNKFSEWDFRLQKRIENHPLTPQYNDRWCWGGKSRKSKRRNRRNRRTRRR